MALQIDIETEVGLVAGYHRIVEMARLVDAGELCVVLHGYPDAAIRAGGASPLRIEVLRFDLATLPEALGRQDAYAAIKDLPAFAGAVDA